VGRLWRSVGLVLHATALIAVLYAYRFGTIPPEQTAVLASLVAGFGGVFVALIAYDDERRRRGDE
jgi:anti-sigma-K factor RskA